jgi:hypothetical protein
VLSIDLPQQPFETTKPLESPQLTFGKASQFLPSISLKIKGKFARNEPFQNLYLKKQP